MADGNNSDAAQADVTGGTKRSFTILCVYAV